MFTSQWLIAKSMMIYIVNMIWLSNNNMIKCMIPLLLNFLLLLKSFMVLTMAIKKLLMVNPRKMENLLQKFQSIKEISFVAWLKECFIRSQWRCLAKKESLLSLVHNVPAYFLKWRRELLWKDQFMPRLLMLICLQLIAILKIWLRNSCNVS